MRYLRPAREENKFEFNPFLHSKSCLIPLNTTEGSLQRILWDAARAIRSHNFGRRKSERERARERARELELNVEFDVEFDIEL